MVWSLHSRNNPLRYSSGVSWFMIIDEIVTVISNYLITNVAEIPQFWRERVKYISWNKATYLTLVFFNSCIVITLFVNVRPSDKTVMFFTWSCFIFLWDWAHCFSSSTCPLHREAAFETFHPLAFNGACFSFTQHFGQVWESLDFEFPCAEQVMYHHFVVDVFFGY